MPKSVLIAGCGFVGLPLARAFASSGWETHGLTSSEATAASLQGESFNVHALDIREKASFRPLAARHFDVVIHCASSGRGGARSYEEIFFAGTQNLISGLDCQHLIFSSSTSVYAQTDCSWVDETAEALIKSGQVRPLKSGTKLSQKTNRSIN